MTVGEDSVRAVTLLVEAVVAALALGVGTAESEVRRLVGGGLGLVISIIITLMLGAPGGVILAIAVVVAAALVPAL